MEEQFRPRPRCGTLCGMPIFEDPLSKSQAAQLRRAVLTFRSTQRKRVFPTTVHIGDPDGTNRSFIHTSHPTSAATGYSYATKLAPPSAMDLAQRADLIGVLLEDYVRCSPGGVPMMWLTRSGEVGYPHDVDHEWLAAGNTAFAECCLAFSMFVISPQGWYDPRSGVVRRWQRLRRR